MPQASGLSGYTRKALNSSDSSHLGQNCGPSSSNVRRACCSCLVALCFFLCLPFHIPSFSPALIGACSFGQCAGGWANTAPGTTDSCFHVILIWTVAPRSHCFLKTSGNNDVFIYSAHCMAFRCASDCLCKSNFGSGAMQGDIG